jgi:hypothetical protein
MSDSIHANGGGVRLAGSEYIVPADVVSSIGNGSSQAGANALDAGIAGLRKRKYGRSSQPPRVAHKDNPVLKQFA